MFNYIFLYLSFISILCLRTASWRKTISAEDELILVRSCFINSEIGFCPISFSQGWILVLEFVGGGGVGCGGAADPVPFPIVSTLHAHLGQRWSVLTPLHPPILPAEAVVCVAVAATPASCLPAWRNVL